MTKHSKWINQATIILMLNHTQADTGTMNLGDFNFKMGLVVFSMMGAHV